MSIMVYIELSMHGSMSAGLVSEFLSISLQGLRGTAGDGECCYEASGAQDHT